MSFFLDTVRTIDRDKPPFERWGSRQKSSRLGGIDQAAVTMTSSFGRRNNSTAPGTNTVTHSLFQGQGTDKNEYYKKYIHCQNKYTLRPKPENYVIYDNKNVDSFDEKKDKILKKLQEEKALQIKMSEEDKD